MLGVWAGLRVSPEGMFRVSVWFQVVFSLPYVFTLFLGLLGRMPLTAMFALVGLGIQLFNIIAVYVATARRKGYPWDLLKWTFPLGSLGYYATPVFAIVGTLTRGADVPGASFLLVMMIYLMPAFLQTALLWWPRAAATALEEAQP